MVEARSRRTGSCGTNANYAHFKRWEREQGGRVSAELEEMVTRDATRKRRRWVKGLRGGVLEPNLTHDWG